MRLVAMGGPPWEGALVGGVIDPGGVSVGAGIITTSGIARNAGLRDKHLLVCQDCLYHSVR